MHSRPRIDRLAAALARLRPVTHHEPHLAEDPDLAIEARDGMLTLRTREHGVDLSARFRAETSSPGAALVDGRRLEQLVEVLPGIAVELSTPRDGYLDLAAGNLRARLPGSTDVGLPAAGDPPHAEWRSGEILLHEIRRLAPQLHRLGWDCRSDALHLLRVDLEGRAGGTRVHLTASNGARVAFARCQLPFRAPATWPGTLFVHGFAARVAAATLGALHGPVRAALAGGALVLRDDSARLALPLHSGAGFPDLAGFASAWRPTAMGAVEREPLLAALRRAQALLDRRSLSSSAILEIDVDAIDVLAPGDAISARESLAAGFGGALPVEGRYNLEYLVEAVAACESLLVGVQLGEPPGAAKEWCDGQPLLVISGSAVGTIGDPLVCMIMPMKRDRCETAELPGRREAGA